jgi:hypothetical protein
LVPDSPDRRINRAPQATTAIHAEFRDVNRAHLPFFVAKVPFEFIISAVAVVAGARSGQLVS